MEAAEIERELEELESRVERLRALYEQYFMGIERMEPQIPRKDVDRRIWMLRREQIRNTGMRFKFQMLIQRYNTFQQYWQRVTREIETGTYRRDVMRAAARVGEKEAMTLVGKKRAKQFASLIEAQKARRGGASDNVEEGTASAPDAAPAAPAEAGREWGDITEVMDEDDAPTPAPAADLARTQVPPKAVTVAAPSAAPTAVPPRASPAPPAPPLPPEPAVSNLSGLRWGGRPKPSLPTTPALAPPPPSPSEPTVVEPPPEVAPPRRPPPPPPRGLRPAAPPAPAAAPPTPAPPPVPAPVVAAPLPPSAPEVTAQAGRKRVAELAAAMRRRTEEDVGGAVTRGLDLDFEDDNTLPQAQNRAPLPSPSAATPPTRRRSSRSMKAVRPPPSAPDEETRVAPPPTKTPEPAPKATWEEATTAIARKPPAPQPLQRPFRAPDTPPAAAPPRPKAEDLSDGRMRQIYAKYVETKRASNESTAGMTYEKLAESLRSQATRLRTSHPTKSVDYEVVVKDGKTMLKPILR